MPNSPIWARIAKTLGYTALVLLSLEGAFALAGIGEQEFLRPDPVLGYIAIPNKTVTWRQEGFGRVRFNSLGMADKERTVPKPAGTVRIAVLGDSYVEALQVNRERNFCSALERKLNKDCPQKNFEVLNFGASAYNVGQMYLRLKHQVMQFQPDVVIVALRPDGIFSLVPDTAGGTMMSARPTFFLQDGKLQLTNALQQKWQASPDGKRSRVTRWLREHSRTYGVVGTIMQDLHNQLPHAVAFNANASSDVAPCAVQSAAMKQSGEVQKATATKYYWPLEQALIKALQDQCETAHAKLILLRLPETPTSTNKWETRLLEELASTNHIPFVETNSDYHGAKAHQLFYTNHFSPAGHQLLADKLESYILSTIGMPSNVSP